MSRFLFFSVWAVWFALSNHLQAAVVARWSFDEPAGATLAQDKGPYNFDITVGTAGRIVAGGKWGNCLQNAGGTGAPAGQVGRVDNILGTALDSVWQSPNFTVEAWLRLDVDPAPNSHILFCGNSTINFLSFGFRDVMAWRWTAADQLMHFYADRPSGTYEHARVFPFQVGRWHHVAWVRYAPTNRGFIFFDGGIVDSDPWVEAPNGFASNGNPRLTVLTSSYTGDTAPFAGSIDELTISDTAVYTGGFIPGRPDDLVSPTPTPYPSPTPTPPGFPPQPTPLPQIEYPRWTDPVANQNMIHILPEGAVLFAFDDYAIPYLTNLAWNYGVVQPFAQPVLPVAGANQIGSGFREEGWQGTVLYAAGKFRMWYNAKMVGTTDNRDFGHFVCYAESNDGINWVRPNLGLFTWDNPADNPDLGPNKNNNICGGTHGTVFSPSVIHDPMDPDPNRRYKMAYLTFKDNKSWNLEPIGWTEIFTSADGKQWTEIGDVNPIQYKMEISTFFRFKGRYFIGGQQYQVTEPLPPGGLLPQRVFSIWSSHVFDKWPEENATAFYKPLQFSAAGSPRPWDGEQLHLGACVWPRGNVAIGLYGQVHTVGYGENSLDDSSKGSDGKSGDGYSTNVLPSGSTCDIGLVLSNDGIHFREPAPGSTFIHHEPLNDNFLIQGTGFANVGDLTYLWIDNNKLTLMIMRRDGFAALEVQPAGATYGSFLTEQLGATGPATLHVNVDGLSAQKPLQLELVEEIEGGYQATPLDNITQNGVHVQVRQQGQPLSIPAGKRFRVRARMVPGQRFYALYASLTGEASLRDQAWGTYR